MNEAYWTNLLQSAGLPVLRAWEELFDDGSSRVEATFSAPLTSQQQDTFLTLTGQAYKVRERRAKEAAKSIPNWATWSEAEALSWLQANIGDPLNTPIPPNPITTTQLRAAVVSIVATMQKQYQVEQAMARMLIAMRNQIWSDLLD